VPLGASRRRQQTRAPDNADALAALVVHDLDGSDVRLGDLWADRPVVLVWLRHYG
jgi:hypothetical protein